MPDLTINFGQSGWDPQTGKFTNAEGTLDLGGMNLGGVDGVEGGANPLPDHYRMAEEGGPSCATCEHYSDHHCEIYDAEVEPDHVSDAHEEVDARALSASEFYLADGETNEDDNLIWKTVLRTGEWKYRPGPGQTPNKKPLRVVDGEAKSGEISLDSVIDAFDSNAIEHVTVPLSHADKVDENTGYIRKLKKVIGDGITRLVAGFEFTEPEIKQKVTNKSIANTSVGLIFDYIRKEDGRKFPIALAHVALTNRPWINGMEPFGTLAASEDTESLELVPTESETEKVEETTVAKEETAPEASVEETEVTEEKDEALAVSEQEHDSVERGAAGDPPASPQASPAPRTPREALRLSQRRRELRSNSQSTTKEGTTMPRLSEMLEGIELSEEARAVIQKQEEELASLQRQQRETAIDVRIDELKELGFSEHPGFLKAVRDIYLSDDQGEAVLLSEDGQSGTTTLTASGIVDRVIASFPTKDGKINFGDQIAESLTGDNGKPPVDATGENLSDEERAEAARKFLEIK